MKHILITATIFVATSYSAYAADAIIHHDPLPVVYDTGHAWTGGYIGFQTGYQNARFKDSYENYGDTRHNSDGILAGIYGGYNFEFSNRMILGVDADLTYNGASQYSAYSAVIDPNTTHDYLQESKFEWSGALRARIGYSMNRWMPYLAGGVAFAQIKNSIYDTNDNYLNEYANMTGWTVGAGVDYALASNTALRLEYRHTDYGRKTFGVDNFEYKTKLKTDEIRIGVAYRF